MQAVIERTDAEAQEFILCLLQKEAGMEAGIDIDRIPRGGGGGRGGFDARCDAGEDLSLGSTPHRAALSAGMVPRTVFR
jgi:hypothetical protein